MKNKILTFIIGVLVGAIITTIGFYIYAKMNHNSINQMPNGEMPQIIKQENGENPPEKPSGEERNDQDVPSEMKSNNNI